MTDPLSTVIAAWDRESSREIIELTALLTDYHLQTEAEKGVPVASVQALPGKYLAELVDPRGVFAEDEVLIAHREGRAAGCLVITPRRERTLEIKRLWTDPDHRGRRVATSLLDAARDHAVRIGAEEIRLSVWEWRADAIALYEKNGFAETTRGEEREQLVCMARTVQIDEQHSSSPPCSE
ncbi:N-acetyltransferase [uncultured Microbacterium sp.]|uniref:GNAT family N-acetyltransferase n=1 Tax=uncultured Microbacterium sp. TaxID=191216 RepID=UPI0025CE62C0|nr:GNAT family N-acetyltransferase [uncultured Microbacterium sp.]